MKDFIRSKCEVTVSNINIKKMEFFLNVFLLKKISRTIFSVIVYSNNFPTR